MPLDVLVQLVDSFKDRQLTMMHEVVPSASMARDLLLVEIS